MTNTKSFNQLLRSLEKTVRHSASYMFVGILILVISTVNAAPTSAYYELQAGESFSDKFYTNAGEPLQFAMSVVHIEGQDFDIGDLYDMEAFGVKILYAEYFGMDDAETVFHGALASFAKAIETKEGYYEVTITNLLDDEIGVMNGHAHFSPVNIVGIIGSAILIGFSSAAFGISFTLMVLFGLIYVAVAIISFVNREMNRRNTTYPQYYSPVNKPIQ